MGLLRIRDLGRPKKTKRKPTKAEREAEASFQKLQDKWASAPKFAHSDKPPKPKRGVKIIDPVVRGPVIRAEAEPPPKKRKASKPKLDAGSTAPKAVQQYTGTKLKGIGQMHKSNAIPVFEDEVAVDIAKMRRN